MYSVFDTWRISQLIRLWDACIKLGTIAKEGDRWVCLGPIEIELLRQLEADVERALIRPRSARPQWKRAARRIMTPLELREKGII